MHIDTVGLHIQCLFIMLRYLWSTLVRTLPLVTPSVARLTEGPRTEGTRMLPLFHVNLSQMMSGRHLIQHQATAHATHPFAVVRQLKTVLQR